MAQCLTHPAHVKCHLGRISYQQKSGAKFLFFFLEDITEKTKNFYNWSSENDNRDNGVPNNHLEHLVDLPTLSPSDKQQLKLSFFIERGEH